MPRPVIWGTTTGAVVNGFFVSGIKVVVGLAPANLSEEGPPVKTLLHAATLISPPSTAAVLLTLALGLHGPRGRKHRHWYTPRLKAVQPVNEGLGKVERQAVKTSALSDESLPYGFARRALCVPSGQGGYSCYHPWGPQKCKSWLV